MAIYSRNEAGELVLVRADNQLQPKEPESKQDSEPVAEPAIGFYPTSQGE